MMFIRAVVPSLSRQCIRKYCVRNKSTAPSSTLPAITVYPDQSGVSIRFPGYGFDDLDRRGNVAIHKIARLGEACRMSLYKPEFTDLKAITKSKYSELMKELINSGLLFAVTSINDIFPAFYRKEHLFNPLDVTDRLVNFGRTSFQHLCETTSVFTGEKLHTSILQVVVVDRSTRKPLLVPSHIIEHFKQFNCEVPVVKIQPLVIPDDAIRLSYTVRWSDADYYLHTNQASYVRICYDAMVQASMRGELKVLNGDLANYMVKTFNCVYQNESKPDDLMDIHVWQNMDNSFLVHSAIKIGDKSIYQGSIEFVGRTRM